MAKKETPRGTKIVGAVVFGGLLAAVVGQKFVPGVVDSQTNTLLAVGVGGVLLGVIAWFATRTAAAAR